MTEVQNGTDRCGDPDQWTELMTLRPFNADVCHTSGETKTKTLSVDSLLDWLDQAVENAEAELCTEQSAFRRLSREIRHDFPARASQVTAMVQFSPVHVAPFGSQHV
jgi:hypothetical protein